MSLGQTQQVALALVEVGRVVFVDLFDKPLSVLLPHEVGEHPIGDALEEKNKAVHEDNQFADDEDENDKFDDDEDEDDKFDDDEDLDDLVATEVALVMGLHLRVRDCNILLHDEH
jgi:hypothetical protein